VNWILAKDRSKSFARILAKVVFPIPGTSSMSKCPWDKKQHKAIFVSVCLPKIELSADVKKSWINLFIFKLDGEGNFHDRSNAN
jgi:hypothetical protein